MKNKLFKINVEVINSNLIINFYEKKSKRLMGTIPAALNHCLICGSSSVDLLKKDVCDGCKMVIDKYTGKTNRYISKSESEKELEVIKAANAIDQKSLNEIHLDDVKALNEVNNTAVHLSSSTPIEDTKVRKTKTVVNYNKASDPSLSFIRIENLEDLYSKVDNSKMSIGKMEALLKYAIQGQSYQAIAQKLNIQEISVKNDYNFLSKYNLVINGTYKPSVTLKVIYGEIAEAPANLVGMDKAAYLKLKEYLKNWISMDKLVKETKMQRRTVLTYIWRLNNLNLIEKRGTVNKEYRFLTV